MPVTNEDLLAVINRNNEEAKISFKKITSTLDSLIAEISELKKKNLDQDRKIIALENEIRFLKRDRKRNNFVLYNLPSTDNEDVNSEVVDACRDVGVNLPEFAINYCYRIGKGHEPRPILVSLINNNIKQKLMKRREAFAEKISE